MDDQNQQPASDQATFTFSDGGDIVPDGRAVASSDLFDGEDTAPGDPTSPASYDNAVRTDDGTIHNNDTQIVADATPTDSVNVSAGGEESTVVTESVIQPTTGSAGPTTVNVSVGGGMIEVISKAKNISMAEAEKVYYAMKAKGQIYGIPGTYGMDNDDIGISAPGSFVIGQDLMDDIDAAAGHTPQREPQQDILGQTDRPQEMPQPPAGAADSTSPNVNAHDAVNIDSAPRSIIDTRIAPFPETPNNL